MRTANRSSRVLFRAALLLSIAAPALLAPSTGHADVRSEARIHFRRGMELIAEGQVEPGIAELQEAYEILPHPNVLYNIARAYTEAGRYEEAIQYFERYAETDPPDRDEVTAIVVSMREHLAATAAPAAEPTAPSESLETPSALASAEEIQAIEDSATQIEALAETSRDTALRQRAERLRALAQALREQQAGTPAEPTTTTPTEPGEPAAAGGRIAVGAGAADVYEERVVSASRAAESPLDAPNSTTTVTAQDIRLSGLGNMAELTRRGAGVEVMSLSPGDTQVSVRGMNQRLNNKLLVLVDGRSVYMDFAGSTFWPSIPVALEDIERIEIIRGPASALYGADAFTGIVNIITKEPGAPGSFLAVGAGNHNQYRGAYGVSGRTGGFAYRLSGGYDYADQWALEVDPERADLEPFSDEPNKALERVYFNGDLRYNFGGGYTSRFGTSVTRMQSAWYAYSRLRQSWTPNFVFAQSHANFSTPMGLSLNTFWNYFVADTSTVEVVPGGIPVQSFDVQQQVVHTELEYAKQFDLGFPHNFTLGASYRFKSIDYSWLDSFHKQHHVAAYIQDVMRIVEPLRFQISARLDRHPLLDSLQFSPRGSLVYRVTEGSAIRATAGTAFRSPTFVESYLEFVNQTPVRGVTAIGLGNDSLDPERITSFEVGYGNQESDYFALEANAYYNLIDDQILLSTIDTFELGDFATGDGGAAFRDDIAAFPIGSLRFNNENQTFRQVGAELGLRVFPVRGLDVYANYAIHDTAPTGDDADLGARADEQRTSRHKINAGVQYRSSFGADVALDFHHVTNQVWSEQVTDTRTGVRFDNFELPAYTILNARVGYRLFEDKLELAVTGTNLVDPNHREHPFGQPVDRRVMSSATVRF